MGQTVTGQAGRWSGLVQRTAHRLTNEITHAFIRLIETCFARRRMHAMTSSKQQHNSAKPDGTPRKLTFLDTDEPSGCSKLSGC